MSEPQFVPQLLTDFARQPGCFEGFCLSELAAGTIVAVNTRHSQYRLLLIDPLEGRALISGGARFPEPTEVRIAGSTAGGSMLKTAWIDVGLKLEVCVGHGRITTSRVVSVAVLSVPS